VHPRALEESDRQYHKVVTALQMKMFQEVGNERAALIAAADYELNQQENEPCCTEIAIRETEIKAQLSVLFDRVKARTYAEIDQLKAQKEEREQAYRDSSSSQGIT
jgi:hypothetical protein